MKRLFILFCVLVTLLSVTVIGVSAEDTEEDTTVTAPVTSDEEVPENTGTSPSIAPANPTTDETSRPSFGEMVNHIWDSYAGEIFSGLTLLTSLVLAYFYKRGLVPVVWNGLDRLNRAGAATDAKLNEFISKAEPVLSGASHAADVAETLGQYVTALDERIRATEGERDRMETMMRGVADLLFGVFQAANLPAYAKEQLGARYNALLSALKEAPDTNEHQEAPAV